jgi:16S rRNA (adenine1518-N6/adenine1519-N6)-dimethyltransferase
MKTRARAGRRRPPLGQHFLHDPSWRTRILGQLSLKASDCWVEIGAGHGEFTLPLAEASRAVAAIERDPKLASALREKLLPHPAARVVEADVLRVDFASLARTLETRKLRLYGSLPYYITSPILRRLFGSLEVIADIHVVVQREVAERLVARAGSHDYGYLSVLTQFFTEPELLFGIPRGAFRPVPRVDSALVRLEPPGAQARLRLADAEQFVKFVGACFRLKRKTLRNNLRGLYEAPQVKQAISAGLSEHTRAEELTVEELAGLYHRLKASRED